jgi:diguanylate cyclase (GGDEF)-like protein
MHDGMAEVGTSLVPVPSHGPLDRLSREVHELANSGRCEEALAAADVYEPAARLLGDELTVNYLLQGRMYAHLEMRHVTEAMAVGQELLARHRGESHVLGEAKVLADLTSACILGGRIAEGMRYLARAGLLLEGSTRRNDRYFSALGSYADAARTAELYEVGASALTELADHDARHDPGPGNYHQQIYLTLLLTWGLRLGQLGHSVEAGTRLRRVIAIVDDWLACHGGPDTAADACQFVAARALALVELGDVDEAIALAEPVVMPLRDSGPPWWACVAHLALGIALRTRGEARTARRELLAAHHLSMVSGTRDEQLIIQYELATLAVQTHGLEACGDLMNTVRTQADLLWQQRLQRLAMLHQARQREELDIERVRTQAALLQDPLTGLGNRRRFDQLMADIDAGVMPRPVSLIVIDVDNFKVVNDTCSHSAGDGILRELGALINAHCRSNHDAAVRYAGDEFAVFLHDDLPNALQVAERIRSAVRSASFDHIAPRVPISVSIGAATLRPVMTAIELFHTADANLYRAKRRGRDRVAA